MFLLICSLPAFVSSIIFMFMPESPKLLMSKGRNEEALEVFQLVHKFNSGSKNAYPVSNIS